MLTFGAGVGEVVGLEVPEKTNGSDCIGSSNATRLDRYRRPIFRERRFFGVLRLGCGCSA